MAGYVVYPPPPATWLGPAHCSPGIQLLSRVAGHKWPTLFTDVGTYGCFNRRPISGGSQKSVHGDGRALDVGHGHTPSTEQLQAMAELVWHLTSGCYSLGVCRMLYNRHAWDGARGWHASTSMGGPHLDHLHLELTPIAAWKRPPSEAVVRCALAAT